MTYKHTAILFDLDGTLLDTSIGVLSSVTHTLSTLNYPTLSPDELRSFIGPPINRRLKELFHISDSESIRIMNLFRTHYQNVDLFKAAIYPGLVELLTTLKSTGIKLGVATYKREDMSIQLLEHYNLAQFFDVIYGSDASATLSKTKIVQNCLDTLNASNDNQTVLIGDSANDAIGATEANIDFIGVTYGFGFETLADVSKYANIGCAGTVPEILSFL